MLHKARQMYGELLIAAKVVHEVVLHPQFEQQQYPHWVEKGRQGPSYQAAMIACVEWNEQGNPSKQISPWIGVACDTDA